MEKINLLRSKKRKMEKTKEIVNHWNYLWFLVCSGIGICSCKKCGQRRNHISQWYHFLYVKSRTWQDVYPTVFFAILLAIKSSIKNDFIVVAFAIFISSFFTLCFQNFSTLLLVSLICIPSLLWIQQENSYSQVSSRKFSDHCWLQKLWVG